MRLVFAGTPAVALPSLDALAANPRHEVVAVVTRPDAPAGRGRTSRPSPVRQRAEALGLEVLTPVRPSEPEFLERLTQLAPDCAAVVAYGALVPPAALEIPTHGWVNLHFSVLPAWRGAAPVQHALLAGDDVTGATTFQLEAGLDTGPVYGVMTTTIGPHETAGELLDRLAADGAGLLAATLDGIEDGTLHAVPQPAEGVSLAPKLLPGDARVTWTHPAASIDRRIRACTPEPGAWTTFRGRRLGITSVRIAADMRSESVPAGEIRDLGKDGVVVGTATEPLRLGSVRPEGKPDRTAEEWARGARLAPGERLE
ncbi:MAG TPA: methionyl-tRNA formyltransferase [Mycobacteriales bacterium]|nr:methionyl-tRNA formyltransferase [Mycobacteriales bacterium]